MVQAGPSTAPACVAEEHVSSPSPPFLPSLPPITSTPTFPQLSMSVSAEASSSSTSSPPLPRHDFFQSDEKFTLSIYVKGLQPSEVSVSFRERAVRPLALLPLASLRQTLSAPATRPLPLRSRGTDPISLILLLGGAFAPRQMKLTLPSGTYDISPFPHPINTEKSTYRVASVKIEISLVKQDVGIKWAALTGEGEGDRGAYQVPNAS